MLGQSVPRGSGKFFPKDQQKVYLSPALYGCCCWARLSHHPGWAQELQALIHPRTPRCSTDESLGGCWFKGCLAEFTGTQGDGGLAEKPQGWRELRVCFCCFFKAAESRSRRKLSWSLGSWRCQGHPPAAAAHIPLIPAWHSPPAAPTTALTSLSTSGGAQSRARPQGCGFTQREVKVWGRQGKQNKFLLPGTCSLPGQKRRRRSV